MKITKENYFEEIEKVKSGNDLQYKNLKFVVTKDHSNTNFKLKSNSLIYFLTLLGIAIISLLFVSVFLLADNEKFVSFGVIPMIAMMYFSRKLSLYFTEKIYKNQINEFFQILKLYNQKKMTKK